ncbi:restriction endonuclease subunit S [Proteus penneri]|uniref:restriction endonuclease subunit S n=1 Tax=Proteus penneri TaxID=102862 RepID=UPI00288AC646|nr:restriction endonuclease subunit S [Proteus penneri]
MTVEKLITDHIDIWSSALQTRSTAGRGSNGKIDLYGIKKLRELILELAMRGKLVPQDPNDEPASELLKRIAAEKTELMKQGKIKKQKPLPEISEDEKPFELPNGWEWVRLGELGYTQTGGTPSKSNAEYFGNEIPFIKPADITTQGVIYDNEGLSTKGADSLGRIAPSGSILMVCIGTIGKCQVINRTCSFNQQINSITPFVDMSEFIYLDISSPYFQSQAWDYSSSTTIAILNKGKWESLSVPIAPISEQSRIVSSVKKLMSLCDQLEKQSLTSLDAHQQLVETLLSTLTDSQSSKELSENWSRISQYFDTLFTTEASVDALKQTILQLAVMGKLVPQDPNDEPASELLKRIEQEKALMVKNGKIKKQKPLPPISDEEKPFELPQGWEWITMQNLQPEFQNGLSSRGSLSGKNCIVIRLADIKNWQISFADTRTLTVTDSESKKYYLDKNDILIIRVNGSADIVGRFILYNGDQHACYCDHFIRLRLPHKGVIDERYLTLIASSSLVRSKISNLFITTAGQKTVNQTHINSLFFPLPPYKEQGFIIDRVKKLFTLCDTLKLRLQSAQQTQLNLADAFTDAALN